VRIAASPISWLPLGTDLPQTWPSAAELHRVLSTQTAGFDVVIIDGDSVRSSLLSATLTDIVGHIVVCVDEGSTGLSEVEAELDAIGPQGGRLRGLTIAGTSHGGASPRRSRSCSLGPSEPIATFDTFCTVSRWR
jgi:hypothetical protein